MKTNAILSAAVLAVSVSTACAQVSAGGSVFADFSLWSPQVQVAEPTDSVRALRIALYGENADVTGVDLNIVGFEHGDFKGLKVGLIYDQVDGDFYGAQILWSVASYVKGDIYGLDAGAVNVAGGEMVGAQFGIWNSVGNEATGLQFGLVNVAKSLNGVQLGLVNVASAGGCGLQVGLVNYLAGSDVFDVFPIVNFNFSHASPAAAPAPGAAARRKEAGPVFLENFFLGFAVVGGVLFALRTAMLFLGWGGDDPSDLGNVPDGASADVSAVDADHSAGGDFRLFSLHGLTSFAFLFGLTGWLLLRDGTLGPGGATLAAVGVGAFAMVASAKIFQMTARLQSDGTVRMSDAVGCPGTVYLGIRPGATGQVTVVARGQSKIFDARAKDPAADLPTGTPVTVVEAGDFLVVERRG